MCEEAGVEVILLVYVSDPIIENGQVKGIFVEAKSGRIDVKVKGVIGATDDASLVERGGVPIIDHVPPRDEDVKI